MDCFSVYLFVLFSSEINAIDLRPHLNQVLIVHFHFIFYIVVSKFLKYFNPGLDLISYGVNDDHKTFHPSKKKL